MIIGKLNTQDKDAKLIEDKIKSAMKEIIKYFDSFYKNKLFHKFILISIFVLQSIL